MKTKKLCGCYFLPLSQKLRSITRQLLIPDPFSMSSLPSKNVKRKRLRRVSFTINSPTEDHHLNLVELFNNGKLKFLIYSEEVASTGQPHLQGYAEFDGQYDFEIIKRIMPEGAHLEASSGSKHANIRYCSKSASHVSGPFIYGDLASNQGQRTDILDALEMLAKSTSLEKCAADAMFASTYVKFSSGFDKLARLRKIPTYQIPEPEEKEIIVLWGTTGTGKSHTAYTSLRAKYPLEVPYFCCDLSGQWFDGYCGQSGAILDDFRGKNSGMRVELFLRLTDKWPLTVPVKGGFVVWAPKTIYITSNEDPVEWFNESSSATQYAVARRIPNVQKLS